MKKTMPLIIALLLFTSFSPTHAELKTFIKEYTYQASEADSKQTCRTLALEQVKRLLLEKTGTAPPFFWEGEPLERRRIKKG
jgi:hypothetical protein